MPSRASRDVRAARNIGSRSPCPTEIAEAHLSDHHRLHRPHGQGRVGGQPVDQRLRGPLEPVVGDDLVDHVQLVHARRRQRIAEQQHLPGGHRPPDLHDLFREEPGRHEPDLRERHPEARAPRGDDQIAMERQLVAARDGVAVDHAEHRQRVALDGIQHGLDRTLRVERAGALAQVHAGAEHRTLRPDHDQTVGLPRLLAEGRQQFGQHLAVQRIALFGTVQAHRADGAVAFDEDGRHGIGRLPGCGLKIDSSISLA